MAVGDSDDGSSLAGSAEWWDGSSWSVVSVPEPAGTSLARVFGVSCTAAGACMAVGVVADSAGEVPLVEGWDGAAWSIESPAVPSGASESNLQAVSCLAASECTAGGLEIVSGGLGVVEGWDGSSWSIEPTPDPGGAGDFEGVSCLSVSVCTAVGGGGSGTLAEGWDGTVWSVQSTPSPSNAASSLKGASCLAVSWCQSVGFSQLNSGGSEQPLAEMYAAGSTPSVSTLASGGVPLGGQVSATATLLGGQAPSGSVTFRLYGPNDIACSSVPVFTSTVPVSGDGSYGSGGFTPGTGETYRWTATYSGDQSNNPASSACGAKGGTVIVSRLGTGLATTASGTIAAGGQVSDTATLSGWAGAVAVDQVPPLRAGRHDLLGSAGVHQQSPGQRRRQLPIRPGDAHNGGDIPVDRRIPRRSEQQRRVGGVRRDRRGRDRNQSHPSARQHRVRVGAARPTRLRRRRPLRRCKADRTRPSSRPPSRSTRTRATPPDRSNPPRPEPTGSPPPTPATRTTIRHQRRAARAASKSPSHSKRGAPTRGSRIVIRSPRGCSGGTFRALPPRDHFRQARDRDRTEHPCPDSTARRQSSLRSRTGCSHRLILGDRREA